MENPRAVMGGNAPNLDEAVTRFDLVGFMLARLETLAVAVRDDRLDRGCLKVLVTLIDTMNRETRTSWAGRDHIADRCGMSVKSAGNYIYQLKALGYLVSERRETPQANNRNLMHYTLAKLSPHEIEAAIERAIGSIRGDYTTVVHMKSARQDGQIGEKVPVGTGKKVPTGTGSARQDGQSVGESACDDGQNDKSARQDGCSKNKLLTTTENNNSSEPKPAKAASPAKEARGTRLDPTPDLCRQCGTWALANFEITRKQAFAEWQGFSDYWTGLAGARARKADWLATWKNWVRNSKKNYRVKTTDADVDAGLFSVADAPSQKSETEIRNEIAARLTDRGYEFTPGDQ